jgi:hypothetical protein
MLNFTEKLVLTNCPTNRSELVARSGMICAFVDAIGSCGSSNSQVCVNCMEAPSGRVTFIGVTASFLLVTGAVILR